MRISISVLTVQRERFFVFSVSYTTKLISLKYLAPAMQCMVLLYLPKHIQCNDITYYAHIDKKFCVSTVGFCHA